MVPVHTLLHKTSGQICPYRGHLLHSIVPTPHFGKEGIHAPYTHRVRYLNNFSRKWSIFEALGNTIPWWKLLGGTLGELTWNQCSSRLKDDKVLHTNPYFACGYTTQVPSAVSATIFGGENST